MTNPMIRIHNVETGEIIDREMTDAEFAQYQTEQTERESKKNASAATNELKIALMQRLGITADEAAILFS
jgi:hypothetical protein